MTEQEQLELWENGQNFIPGVIDRMATLVQDNLIDDAYLDSDTLSDLSDEFLAVPMELREVVFRLFREELTERGIKYTLEAFKGNA